ncbi:hypothetical protein BDEG_24625 [Batrachochytrium dendrobatidis JEL423]|uniref:Rap-GAP domain-containing protein n=1 Tax=Batrachochytrium dendrobatidis (strain JEL423) TaxID=403673 RepID=A0A177WNL8_BATDL|nr:hypothetical protein BDEG_24625 [Batrachochytrium dendrobatidis JEL423]
MPPLLHTAMPDERRFERLLKKVKPFLDEKQKAKLRIKSLLVFLEGATESDQKQFFQEHGHTIYNVTLEYLFYRIARITEKTERTYTPTSKDVVDLHEIFTVLSKIIQLISFNPLPSWATCSLNEVFEILLATGNHQRLRVDGFRLLLQYLSIHQTDQIDEYVQLYFNTIQLDLFESALLPTGTLKPIPSRENELSPHFKLEAPPAWVGKERGLLLQKPIKVIKKNVNDVDSSLSGQAILLSCPNDTILYPATSVTKTDQCELIDEILQNILNLSVVLACSTPQSGYSSKTLTNAISSELGSKITTMWTIFRKTYLRILFPSVSRYVGIEIGNNQGFECCPPQILQVLVRFIVRTLCANFTVSPTTPPHEFAAIIITRVILASDGSRETVQEIIKQALHLPISHYKTSELALFVIATWLSLSPEYNLMGSTSFSVFDLDQKVDEDADEVAHNKEKLSNESLRRYIQNIQRVFFQKSQVPGEQQNQISLYQDAFDIYRSIATESFATLETKTWQLLMQTLLEIQEKLLSNLNIMNTETSLVHTLAEVLLIVWIRSRSTDETLWKQLRNSIVKCTVWSEYVKEWANITIKFTHVMADKVYDFDVQSGVNRLVSTEKEFTKLRGHRKTIGTGKNARDASIMSIIMGSTTTYIAELGHAPIMSKSYPWRDASISKDSRFLDKLAIPPASPILDRTKREKMHIYESSDFSNSSTKESSSNAMYKYLREKVVQYSGNPDCNLYEPVNDDESLECCIVKQHKSHTLSSTFGSLKDIEFLNAENSLWIWKSILCTLGRINEIKIPAIHFDAISCFVQVWDTLNKIRQSQKFDNMNMPSLFDFAPIIFSSADLPIEFIDSIVVAVGCISRMMCKRHDQEFSEEYYTHYYRILEKWLSSKHIPVINSILLNTQRIFCLSLPGALFLIPSFIKAINYITTQHNLSDEVATASIQILSSLVCVKSSSPTFENKVSTSCFNGSEYPADTPVALKGRLSDISPSTLKPNLSFSNFSTVKENLLDLAVKILTTYTVKLEESKIGFMEQIIWSLGVMAFEECLVSAEANVSIVYNCIGVLLDNISLRDPRLARAAIDCLTLFAHSYETLQLDRELVHQIIDRLVIGISENMQFDEKTRKQASVVNSAAIIVSMLFRCLVDWLSCTPKTVMTNPNIALRVSEVIEEAIHISCIGVDAQQSHSTVRSNSTDDGALNPELRDSSSIEKEIISSFRAIRSCAENAMMHLLHHTDNFAPINGPAMMSSHISEPHYEETNNHSIQTFTYNDNFIISFVDIEQGSRCRIIMRNCTGKYVWDTHPFYKSISEVEPTDSTAIPYAPMVQTPLGSAAKFKFNDDVIFAQEPFDIKEYDSDSESEEISPKNSNMFVPDVLEQLLKRIGDQHADCLLENQPETLNTPSNTLLQGRAELSEIIIAIKRQVQDETARSKQPNRFPKDAKASYKDYIRASPLIYKESPSILQCSRLLLSHMGLLTFDYTKTGDLHLLSKTPSLARDIKGLDRKYSRDVAKVAVIYVAPGEEDEYSIFRNNCGSPEYNDFVSSLGWKVDLAKHPGYLGGLERSMVNGGVATYFCTSTLEIMFHDVTKMPTDSADPKQLKKKRHIGNDHVHVIWNEHYRDYKWDTIGGDFGNAQIAITPLPNGMYAVDTYRDSSVEPFGPLQSQMVVSKIALGPLVRSTAYSAYRAALHSGTGKDILEQHPFSSRKETIGIISSRHKVANWTYEKLMDQIFTNGRESKQYSSNTRSSDAPILINEC